MIQWRNGERIGASSFGASGSAMIKVYLVVAGSKPGSAVKLKVGGLMVSVQSQIEYTTRTVLDHSPKVEKVFPSSTALLTYETLNAALGRKSGIKFAFAGSYWAGVGGMMFAARKAFLAAANSAGVAMRHVWRDSKADSGSAIALTEAARARKENNMMDVLS